MPDREVDQLIQEIRMTLEPVVSSNLTTASAPPKIFEAYVLMLILQAALNENARRIRYQDVNGNPTNEFVFRGGPGYIYSTAQNYTHAIIEFDNKPSLEAHTNIRVSGKSNVLHECDVAVLYRAEAEACRRNNVQPRYSKLLIAVECKYYDSGLSLGLARAFIGLDRDLSGRRNEMYFVTNTTHESIQTLLAYHKQNWQNEIRPSEMNNVSRLRSLFQETFKNFKQTS